MPHRSRAWFVAKTLFGLAVIIGVSYYFIKTLNNPDQLLGAVRFKLLLPAGLLYICCHFLWGTFWWQLLRFEDELVSWPRTVATYFISQFGKYVPGKAWVIIVRIAMLGRSRHTRRAVAVTGIFETLTSMGAGALLGIALLPMTGLKLPAGADSLPLFILVAGVPLLLFSLLKISQIVVNSRKSPKAIPIPVPSLAILARGLLQNSIGWCLLAVSLQFVIASVRNEPLRLTGETFLANLAAVTLSYTAGFVVLVAPGGLGVREWVLSVLVAARWTDGEADAVVVAILLRLTWTIAELLLAGSLWLTVRKVMHER